MANRKQFARKGIEKKEDNILVEKKAPAKYQWFEYRDIYSGLKKPMSEKGIEALADELVNWAKVDEEAWKVSQFPLAKGIDIDTWNSWKDKYPSMRMAIDNAKSIIGNRREIGAIKNKLSTTIVNYTMPFYDQEWKSESERLSALRKKEEDGKSTFVINLVPIPSSNLVPDRKE